MRFAVRLIVLPALVAALFAGAAGASSSPGARGPAVTSVADATIIVRAPVASASALVGDEIRVELRACAASCGYTWRVTRDPTASVAQYVSTSYRRFPASVGLVGGYEIESVTFLATGQGTTVIVLKYFPPGRDRTPTKTYRLLVRVH